MEWRAFGVYVVLLCLLPSGTLFGIPVKMLAFLPLLYFASQRLLRESNTVLQLLFVCVVFVCTALYTLRSLMSLYYADFALSQLKDVLTTFAGCLFIRLFTCTAPERLRFLRLCIATVAFGSVLKLAVVGYAFAFGVSISSLLQHISTAFGVQLMTLDLEDFSLRVQWPSDNLLPICVFALVALRKRMGLRSWPTIAVMALLLVSTLLTFSRYIWVSFLLGALLGMLVAKKDHIRWIYLAVVLTAVVSFWASLTELIGLRFSSALAGSSDMDRVWQITQLTAFFWQAPLLGHGMASYPLDFKRSLDLPYAYEVQILALFGQFGVVGVCLLLGVLLNYYRKAFDLRRGGWTFQAAVAVMLANFIGAGIFNPCLLVSFSAVCYGMCFALAKTDAPHAETSAPTNHPLPSAYRTRATLSERTHPASCD